LWERDIKTIENLLQYSKKELSLFRKLGPFAVLEIEKVLANYGFELKA
jgi:DNA-directed RNA polymerase alpha subunit